MTITLVTGATGLVGNNTVRSLLDKGRRVRVLAREGADPRPLAGLDVDIARGDVRDRDSVARAMHGVETVVHAAAHVHIGWTGMADARAINVEGTRHVAEAAFEAGARLVHVSTVDALGIADSAGPADEDSPRVEGVPCPYVITKREAEQVILEWVDRGLHASIVNPTYVIGPYDWKPSSGRMLLQVARGWGLWAPMGANNYCDARAVADGIVAALAHGRRGRRYILSGPRHTYFQAWRVFAKVTGGTPPLFPAGPLLRIGAGRCGDLWGKLTGREPDVNSASTAVAAEKRNSASSRAEAELGYRPRSLDEAAGAAWDWFRANGYV
jgi:dihydroflavonol-4-reductase